MNACEPYEPDRLDADPRIRDLSPEQRLRLRGFSRRESEAVLLRARGRRVREIADCLDVSEGTVKKLLAAARARLDCESTHDLFVRLLREDVLRLAELVEMEPAAV